MRHRFVRLGLLVLAVFLMISCASSGSRFKPAPELSALQKILPAYPATRFAVFTDPHLYDAELGVSGRAFEDYLNKDRKLLAESGPLMDAVVDRIGALDVDFVIVCGDLTKDGERHNHRLAAAKLRRLQAAGKPVFVVPGNHDIENGEAVRFDGDHSVPVPTISGAEFAEIYRDFGYAAALERDGDSLSYVAEPVAGLWLLALDSCRWKENKPGHHALIGGSFSAATVDWIERMLRQAKLKNKAVIVFEHHGVMEHYPHNAKFYGRYLVDDHETIADMLSAYGVQLVFTGHFHAQDITSRTFSAPPRTLYDIETGSTVTAPCPYRIVRIRPDQKAEIDSRFIAAIASRETDFAAYAADYVYHGTITLADTALEKYGVGAADRARLSPQISRAYVTHLKGDEVRPATIVDTAGCGLWARFVMKMQFDLIDGWYTDLAPADNRLTIDLATGRGRP